MLRADQLDPQIQPIVDAANEAASQRPPLEEQTVEERRLAYVALSRLGGPGPELDTVEALDLDGVAGRLYAVEEPQRIVIYYHGGGWTIGDLNTHDPVCRQLAAASGATVISVDYRLGPEHRFPAAVDDAWSALSWVDAHRGDFGADPTVVVAGDSAGGNLAAVSALWARDGGIELGGQVLIYPSVDIDDDSLSMSENGEGFLLTAESMRWFSEQYQPDSADWRASPLRASTLAGVAPALVITAGFDPLRDQGRAYANALSDAAVAVESVNYPAMPHVFFQLAALIDDGRDAIERVGAFVQECGSGTRSLR